MQVNKLEGKCLARVDSRRPVHREDLCRRHHRKHEMLQTTTRED